MKKTLFTAALACLLTVGGFTLSAATYTSHDEVTFNDANGSFKSNVSKSLRIIAVSKGDVDLEANLQKFASFESEGNGNRVFGYKVNNGDFVPLSDAFSKAKAATGANDNNNVKAAPIHLGTFKADDIIQFGSANADGTGFVPIAAAASVAVASDAGYYAGYNPDSFYQLDFAENPFDGMIDVAIIGEPLPASPVTLLIALGAAVAFLLYNNRRHQRAHVEQA